MYVFEHPEKPSLSPEIVGLVTAISGTGQTENLCKIKTANENQTNQQMLCSEGTIVLINDIFGSLNPF